MGTFRFLGFDHNEEIAMGKDAAIGNQSSEDDLNKVRLQKNLELIQSRMGVEEEVNPNIRDTPFTQGAHGFWFDNRIRMK